MGGYFLILQRDVTAAFAAPVNLTYTSGICFLRTPNGVGSAAIGFGGGGHVSYLDSGLAPGTYFYRLVLYPNGVSITSGTYDVYERSMSLLRSNAKRSANEQVSGTIVGHCSSARRSTSRHRVTTRCLNQGAA